MTISTSRMKEIIKDTLNLVFLKGFFPKAQANCPYIDNSNIKNEKYIFVYSLPDTHLQQVTHPLIQILQQISRGPVPVVIYFYQRIPI